jgi:hypothetical protein
VRGRRPAAYLGLLLLWAIGSGVFWADTEPESWERVRGLHARWCAELDRAAAASSSSSSSTATLPTAHAGEHSGCHTPLTKKRSPRLQRNAAQCYRTGADPEAAA